MPLVDYTSRYFSGGFSATFGSVGGPVGVADVDIGTTERGVRVGTRFSRVPIQEDRFANTEVDAMHTGIEAVMITVESLIWDSPTTPNNPMFRYANALLNGLTAAPGELPAADLGKSIMTNFADVLTLIAITGKLSVEGGATVPLTLTAAKAVPAEPLDVLLSLRGPIRVPFGFVVYPDPTEYVNDKLSFYVLTGDNA